MNWGSLSSLTAVITGEPVGPSAMVLAQVALLSIRVGAVFLMTPVLYLVPLPVPVRLLLMLALSVAIAAGLGWPSAMPGDGSGFFGAALREAAVGATLGLGVLLGFGAFSVAGQLLDVQMGYGMAQVFDPVLRRPVPVLTSAFQYVGVLVFFLLNGHHALLRGIAYSVQRLPIGAPWSLESGWAPLLRQTSEMLSLGFALVAPVVFCILMVEFALGVVARNLPQMNMFTMGIPVKIVTGLIALSLWMTGMGAAMTRVYGSIVRTWEAMFHG